MVGADVVRTITSIIICVISNGSHPNEPTWFPQLNSVSNIHYSDQLLASKIINMRLLKVFLLFAFLLCLMKPCLVATEMVVLPPGVNGEGFGRRIRFVGIS